MGMSASQARLLSITARLHDVELKAQHIEAQKIALSMDQDEVYQTYCDALDQTKIQVAFSNNNGSFNYVDACYNTVAKYQENRARQYALQDAQSGQVLLDKDTIDILETCTGEGDNFSINDESQAYLDAIASAQVSVDTAQDEYDKAAQNPPAQYIQTTYTTSTTISTSTATTGTTQTTSGTVNLKEFISNVAWDGTTDLMAFIDSNAEEVDTFNMTDYSFENMYNSGTFVELHLDWDNDEKYSNSQMDIRNSLEGLYKFIANSLIKSNLDDTILNSIQSNIINDYLNLNNMTEIEDDDGTSKEKLRGNFTTSFDVNTDNNLCSVIDDDSKDSTLYAVSFKLFVDKIISSYNNAITSNSSSSQGSTSATATSSTTTTFETKTVENPEYTAWESSLEPAQEKLDNANEALEEANQNFSTYKSNNPEYNYYKNLKELVDQYGYKELDENYISGDAGYTWFNNMVKAGLVTIKEFIPSGSSKGWSDTDVTTSVNNNYLQEVEDETGIKKAEAEYEHALNLINQKDKKFDTELSKLETEEQALTTEIESIEKVRDDNSERNFGIFG